MPHNKRSNPASVPTRVSPGGPGAAVIEVRGLRKNYYGRPVLDGVDLAVERGEVFAILGPNGAGKTTMVEILEGFRPRDGGRVQVLGLDPADGGLEYRQD